MKNIEFSSIRGQGVVYNVIATDKRTGSQSAYVPVVTYACDLHSNGTAPCQEDIPVVNIIFGLVFALAGLFLCWVGHNSFHAGGCGLLPSNLLLIEHGTQMMLVCKHLPA